MRERLLLYITIQVEIREQDRYLPVANIARIMKQALPPNAKVAKDAKESIQAYVSEFIAFITSEASDKCLHEKRKTINGDDLLYAMTTLGFASYVPPLQIYFDKYKATVKGEKPEKVDKPKKEKPFKMKYAPNMSPSPTTPETLTTYSSGMFMQASSNPAIITSSACYTQPLLPSLPFLPGAKCTVSHSLSHEDLYYNDSSNTLRIEGVEYGVPGYKINYKENIPFDDPSLCILGGYASYQEIPGVMNGPQLTDLNMNDHCVSKLPPSGMKTKIEKFLVDDVDDSKSSVTRLDGNSHSKNALDGIAANRTLKKQRVEIS